MDTLLADLDLSVDLEDTLLDLLSAYSVSGHSPRTITLISTHVRRLIAFVAEDGVTTLDGVTTAHVNRFLASEKARGLAPASLHVSLRNIRRFFSWAISQDLIDKNPAKAVIPPRVVIEPVEFLSDPDIEKLLKSIAADKTVEGVRDLAFVRVLMETGLRRGEITALRTTDVDLDQRTINVRPATSKTRRARVVPVGLKTAMALRQWLRVRAAYEARRATESGDALWVGDKGPVTPSGALQCLHRRLAEAGLPKVGLHSFRHRFAALAVQNGLPMTYLMNIGGWASATLPTQRYGQWGVESRAIEAYQKLLDR